MGMHFIEGKKKIKREWAISELTENKREVDQSVDRYEIVESDGK